MIRSDVRPELRGPRPRPGRPVPPRPVDRRGRLKRVPGSVWLTASSVVVLFVASVMLILDHRSGSGVSPSGALPEPVLQSGPTHVVATQGPVGSGRAVVTWERSDPRAIGYDVRRDGTVIGSVELGGDPWDDLVLQDTGVSRGRHSYEVRARFAEGGPSEWSPAFVLELRTDEDLGTGQVFEVDSFPGTDRARAQAAVDAAAEAGGGVVLFGPRLYAFDDTLRIDATDDVVLRGAGVDTTYLQPTFDGGTEDACGPVRPLVQFLGATGQLGSRSAEPIAVGQRTVRVGSAADLAPGQVVVFDEANVQIEPSWFEAQRIDQDPGAGNDRRYPWDANEIVAVEDGLVTFRYPFSQQFSADVGWQVIERGLGNGLESMTVQGRGPQETAYQRLVDIDDQAHFSLADVHARWANRNLLAIGGYDVDVVGFLGDDGGVQGWQDEACKYKVSILQAANVTVVGAVMGDPTHDRNRSFIISQFAQRVVVRNSRFYGSRTHAVNEHGGGSRHHVYENNYFSTGPNSEGAVGLGNGRWGFGGPTIVRNNTFENNTRDLVMFDHPYEVRFFDNVSRGCIVQCVLWSGWGPGDGYSPIADPALYGSARLTIARNRFESAQSVGIHLGNTYSQSYPYLGVKDVVIADNQIDSVNSAIRLFGDEESTQRFQVSGNTGTGRYQRPPFSEGSYWADNVDRVDYGEPTPKPWTSESFEWEAYESAG